jgi:predicted kinase
VPVLLLLNGAPGVGKTTLARRWVEDHPLALCLDIDVVRGLLGRWRDYEGASGLLARDLAVDMARRHLAAGRDVVVPQYLARDDLADRLSAAARSVGACYVEVLLTADPDQALRRYRARADDPALAVHHAVAHRVMGGEDGWRAMRERVERWAQERSSVIVVPTASGEIDDGYRRLRTVVAERC